MRGSPPLRVITCRLVVVITLSTACVIPSDTGRDLRIEVGPIVPLIRGDTVHVVPTLVDPDGVAVPNATFAFTSNDETVALVQSDGMVLGANEGSATVTITSTSAMDIPPADVEITVLAVVAVDSMRPTTVRYGADVALFGRGLDPGDGALVVTIDGVPLPVLAYAPVDTAAPGREGVLTLRVAPPLRTAGEDPMPVNVTVTGALGAASTDIALRVDPVDVFEPNVREPASLGAVTQRAEWIGLAFEPGDTIAPVDWYTFTTTEAGDWTITLKWGPTAESLTFVQVIPNGVMDVALGPVFQGQRAVYYPNGASVIGAGPLCRGDGFFDRDAGGFPVPSAAAARGGTTGPRETSITLEGLAPGTHHLLVLGFAPTAALSFAGIPSTNRWGFDGYYPLVNYFPVRYDLTIAPGVAHAVSPDAYEPNDVCEASAAFMTLGGDAVDSIVELTSDGPWDNDWLRITADRAGALVVAFDAISPGVGLSGALLTTAAPGDSAWFVARFSNAPEGRWDGALVQCAPDPTAPPNFFCPDGEALTSNLSLTAGSYDLLIQPDPALAAPYALEVSWVPDPAPAASGEGEGGTPP